MRAFKAVKQNYATTPQILQLLDEFRLMVNDCVRIGIETKVTSMRQLSKKAYCQLSRHDVPACYRLTAISKAAGLLRNYRQTQRKMPDAKKPFASKLMLTDCYSFKLAESYLRLTVKPRQYCFIKLNYHTLQCIAGYDVRSVCLTPSTLSLTYAKTVENASQECLGGLIGVDRNLNNVTISTLQGKACVYDLSGASKAKALCREVKSHFKRNDVRIARKIQQKYGAMERHRVQPIFHRASKCIVEQAKTERLGIVLENLKGIRKLYRKGNGQSKQYRSRLNGWSFFELQRQIEYKARWEGIPVIYVPAAKTSSTCAICGCNLVECTGRKVWCPRCQCVWDRDVHASYKIAWAGVRFAPKGLLSEAMVQEPPQDGVILTVDNSQPTHPSKS